MSFKCQAIEPLTSSKFYVWAARILNTWSPSSELFSWADILKAHVGYTALSFKEELLQACWGVCVCVCCLFGVCCCVLVLLCYCVGWGVGLWLCWCVGVLVCWCLFAWIGGLVSACVGWCVGVLACVSVCLWVI